MLGYFSANLRPSKYACLSGLKSILLNGLVTEDVVTAYIGLETKLLFMLTSWNESSVACLVTNVQIIIRLVVLVASCDMSGLATFSTHRRAIIAVAPSRVEALSAALCFEALFPKVFC